MIEKPFTIQAPALEVRSALDADSRVPGRIEIPIEPPTRSRLDLS